MEKNNKKILKFPKNFLWGTSTSAYQVEGGIKNDWSEWENDELRIKNLKLKGLNPDNFVCEKACDFYHLYEEDFDLAVRLNNNAVRFGIEWARIEPKEGKWNMDEIEHYRKVLQAAKKRNLKVVLTLWHWTNPIWIAKNGGWVNKKTVNYFTRYVELIVKELGEYVSFWITLNEPMVHILNGYITGKFPPNEKDLTRAKFVFSNLIKAHNKSYQIIHNKYPQARVSITKLVNYFEPAREWCPNEWILAKIFHYFWNHKFLNKVKKQLDFIAFDYYFHDRIVWYPPFIKNKNKEVTDMGWEIYPEGIYHVIKYLAKFNKPIYIMENGLADKNDIKRADFIINHLKYVHKAIKEGVDVRGYFYWSLLDNFEWAHGWEPKFGLYEMDRATLKRTARPSAGVYREICRSNLINVNNQ
ncbi:MAG: glycoside hydrolase family 1 protein [Patescibacteria group bacterium]